MLNKTLLAVAATAAALQAGTSNVKPAAAVEHSNVTMYVWADKYVYQPGEQLTLKWTVKTNDPYTYTVVAFRQNNQTGRKTYFGASKTSDTPVDIFGKTADQGFQAQAVADATRGVLI